MLSGLFSSPTVKITLEEDDIFIHPVATSYPTVDPVLRGTALVTLPSRRAIKKFKVVFEGLCDAFGGDGWAYESTVALHKEVEQDFRGEVFEAGNHAFNFSFIVPSSAAVSQRCAYGRIRYYVKAIVDFEDGLIRNSVSSAPTALWLAANPSPPGELPYPTDVSFQHYSEDLGPVGIGIASPHLTVAALCNVRLSLLGPPQPVNVISVNGIITQTFEVHYTDGKVAKPKPRQFTLTKVDQRASPSLCVAAHNPVTCPIVPLPPGTTFPADAVPSALPTPSNASLTTAATAPSCATAHSSTDDLPPNSFRPISTCCAIVPDQPIPDPSPLASVVPGQEFHHSRICRVPDDDHVRPTTLEGTETKIRVSHKISVEVRYRKAGDEEDMVLTIAKPVTIASCCCLVDSLYLPAYSACAPKTVTRPVVPQCACNMSVKSLFDRDGAALERAGSIDMPSTPPRLIGIDGSPVCPGQKTPSWTDGGGSSLASFPTSPLPDSPALLDSPLEALYDSPVETPRIKD
ncbi:hypothetical protein JCM8097_001011 [Rhodosporidiobolus ruineniae]